MDKYTGITITPCMGGGQNFETYWVGGSNIHPITRERSIQYQRPYELRNASIIVNN